MGCPALQLGVSVAFFKFIIFIFEVEAWMAIMELSIPRIEKSLFQNYSRIDIVCR
jgi:Na+-transporting NADH:ubiquinone oxidoreductase subunit NqrE